MTRLLAPYVDFLFWLAVGVTVVAIILSLLIAAAMALEERDQHPDHDRDEQRAEVDLGYARYQHNVHAAPVDPPAPRLRGGRWNV